MLVSAAERIRRSRPCLARALVSVFALWHAGALLIGPAPESRAHDAVYVAYQRYLTPLHLNNGWAFFAPNPHSGVRMHYVLTDAAGGEHRFDFTQTLERGDTAFQRFTMLQDYLWVGTEPYATHAARYLCNRHPELAARTIRLEFYRVGILTPEQYLAGVRPLDPDNLIEEVHEPVGCTP
ncbi:MAG: hypothetical protein OXT09_37705 [Myxococcales bacterium]|nr:hypothetical protein [Myxococcales bacterium]